MTSAAADIESEHKGETGDVAAGQTRRAVYGAGVDDRGKVKGKWRKGGDRDLMRSDSSKRRRSTGWFKRLASSFQTTEPSSASEELREGVPSLLPEVAEHDVSSGKNDKKRWLSSTAPATTSSATSSRGMPQLEGDDVWDGDAPLPKGGGAGLGVVGKTTSRTDAGFLEFVAESARRAAREPPEGGAVVTHADSGGAEAQAETEGETSDYETGSSTTEGFGSDDAGDLWEGGRRSTLMGPLGRTSFMPNDDGMRGEIEMKDSSSGIGIGGEGKGGNVSSTLRATEEQADGGGGTPGAQAGGVGAGGVGALIEGEAMMESGLTPPAVGADSFVTAVEAESAPNSPHGVKHGDGDDHADRESNVGQEGRGYSSALASYAEGAKDADISTPVAKPKPKPRSYFGSVSPSPAPPSILPSSSPETDKKEDLLPVAVEQHTPSPFAKFGSSPAISDGSSSKESPRAWRLSWWARASERHPPSAPVGTGENEEADGGTGTSFAAALDAAAAGGDEAAAAALSAGGAFAPSFNAGDAPAVVDGGDKTVSAGNTDGAAAAGVAAEVDVERRARRRAMRRRREKPWLSNDQLTDTQARPLEAASEYLDVGGLGRSVAVCRAWRGPLSGEEGRRRWMRCVRLPDGVPDMWRAKFYLHILYDQPSWVRQVRDCVGSLVPSDAGFRLPMYMEYSMTLTKIDMNVMYVVRHVITACVLGKTHVRGHAQFCVRNQVQCLTGFSLSGPQRSSCAQRSCTKVAAFTQRKKAGASQPQDGSIRLFYSIRCPRPRSDSSTTPCCFDARYL